MRQFGGISIEVGRRYLRWIFRGLRQEPTRLSAPLPRFHQRVSVRNLGRRAFIRGRRAGKQSIKATYSGLAGRCGLDISADAAECTCLVAISCIGRERRRPQARKVQHGSQSNPGIQSRFFGIPAGINHLRKVSILSLELRRRKIR